MKKRIYLYTVYERVWHWLQAGLIFVLLLTGVEIHWPQFALFGFTAAVDLHNVLAAVLLANAFLALFYHLSTGEIRQFIPAPRDYFSLAAKQARYYLRGIFRGEEHPFEHSPDQKMNPLQQVTYLMLLNVLLPAQIVTGILLWGAEYWPAFTDAIGGLRWLATIHAFVAWSLVAFVITHMYLTTTGHKPLTLVKAMVTGWEETDEEEKDGEEAAA